MLILKEIKIDDDYFNNQIFKNVVKMPILKEIKIDTEYFNKQIFKK